MSVGTSTRTDNPHRPETPREERALEANWRTIVKSANLLFMIRPIFIPFRCSTCGGPAEFDQRYAWPVCRFCLGHSFVYWMHR